MSGGAAFVVAHDVLDPGTFDATDDDVATLATLDCTAAWVGGTVAAGTVVHATANINSNSAQNLICIILVTSRNNKSGSR